ncbi:PLP-dependent transferase [Salinicola tamaricis]|uniref:PLP-dependent transferase n=1 Tax=Salinicola tamaricis TaxID=1771309 RepID=UPI001A91877F|nr:PLP-dependent transferase [Salinicola tamaricis]
MQPLSLGATVSLMAGTKYVVGHSDVMMGSVSANGETGRRLREMAVTLGQSLSSDDAYLALRGLRTLACRMDAHGRHAEALGGWLCEQPRVARVHQPCRPEHPGHAWWQRDFRGSNGLLTLEFEREVSEAQVDTLVDSLACSASAHPGVATKAGVAMQCGRCAQPLYRVVEPRALPAAAYRSGSRRGSAGGSGPGLAGRLR